MDAGYKMDDFVGGRVSMVINGPWNYRMLQEQKNLEFGVAPLPEDATRATNIGGENLFIFRSTPEKERAAWEFALWAMSPDFQRDWAMETGYLPVNREVVYDPTYARYLEENPKLKIFLDQMEFGKVRPPVPHYPELSNHLGRAIEKVLLKRASPAEALQEAAEAVEYEMERRN
jgi:multiple sugar transport system substrate-binding protein